MRNRWLDLSCRQLCAPLFECESNWRRIAVVPDQTGQRNDQPKAFVGTGQQQDAAVGTDLPRIEGGGDLLLAKTWQSEGQKGIVVVGGHVCPGLESGVDNQSLRD
jgi:hypothetical protein